MAKLKKAQSGTNLDLYKKAPKKSAVLTEMGKKTTRAAINKRTSDMAKSLDKASVFGKNYVAPGDTTKKKPVSKPKAQKGASVKKAPATAKYVSPYKSEKTADSTQYFKDKEKDIDRAGFEIATKFRPVTKGYMLDTARKNNIEREYDKERQKNMSDLNRQRTKGLPGFDKYGNPMTYKQASGSKKKNGGKLTMSKVVKKPASKKK